jgi:hypothetical protein
VAHRLSRRGGGGAAGGKVPYYTAPHTTPHTNLHLNKNREDLRQRKLPYNSVSSRKSCGRAKGPGTGAGAFPMAHPLSGEGPRGPRRGAQGSCGTPRDPLEFAALAANTAFPCPCAVARTDGDLSLSNLVTTVVFAAFVILTISFSPYTPNSSV